MFNIDYCCNNCIYLLKQLTKEYPEILTQDNIWIAGITQEPSSHEYYLVFYHINVVLDKIIQINSREMYMSYTDFNEIKEIGSGCYATVYTAKYKNAEELVVLRRFKNFEEMMDLFIFEVSNL